jgi:XTP/dITP diphosphohydrolase
VAVVRGGEVLFQAQESVEGLIAEEMRGENGFGYDPLFFYPPFGKTFGEVPRADKDRVSHRGKAFTRLREFLAGLPEAIG